jgi:hypothetical protein
VNIADPAAPYETGYYDTPGYSYGVAVFGNHAYVGGASAGLRIINITNPAAPYETGYYNTLGSAHGVAVSGNYAYVADIYHFEIFDCSVALGVEQGIQAFQPLNFKLLNPYPNPFNTQITFEFEVPRASDIVLKLYDVQGRVIDIVAQGRYSIGHHNLYWNGSNISSGIYFLRMQAEDFSDCRKVILIK